MGNFASILLRCFPLEKVDIARKSPRIMLSKLKVTVTQKEISLTYPTRMNAISSVASGANSMAVTDTLVYERN